MRIDRGRAVFGVVGQSPPGYAQVLKRVRRAAEPGPKHGVGVGALQPVPAECVGAGGSRSAIRVRRTLRHRSRDQVSGSRQTSARPPMSIPGRTSRSHDPYAPSRSLHPKQPGPPLKSVPPGKAARGIDRNRLGDTGRSLRRGQRPELGRRQALRPLGAGDRCWSPTVADPADANERRSSGVIGGVSSRGSIQSASNGRHGCIREWPVLAGCCR
jgi:hypothetical protein